MIFNFSGLRLAPNCITVALFTISSPFYSRISPRMPAVVSPEPSRVLRREWKFYKPHLPRWSSLPNLQLTPTDRPLFSCKQCGFTNTLVPLCLWCFWSSKEAMREFEESIPRSRRMTSPPGMVTSATPMQSCSPSTSTCSVSAIHQPRTARSRVNVPTVNPDNIKIQCIASRGSHDAFGITIVREPRRRDRSTDGDMHQQSIHYSLRPISSAASLKPAFPTFSLPMNSNTNTSPQLTPTLRKKKRQTFEKTSIHSISPLSSPSKSPTRKADQRTRHVEPIPRPRVSSGVRLGHPKRPYYSAIRKSKTTQALADPQPPRARPLHMSHPISVLKCPASNADDLHGSPRFVPASMGMEGAGFSLSGEIELRMQLAQRQTASNDFKFVRKARGRGISVTLRRPFAWAGRELRAVMSRNK